MGWRVGYKVQRGPRANGIIRELTSLEPEADPFWAEVEWPDGEVTREYTRELEDGRAEIDRP